MLSYLNHFGRYVACALLACLAVLTSSAPTSGQGQPEFCIFPYRCPTAARITPQVGKRGTQVTLLLQGARLQQIEDVLFYGPGIKYVDYKPVQQVPDDKTLELRSTPPGTAAALTLDIAADCPLGEHFLRIRTNDQLSEMLSFWVSPFPCLAETHLGNDSPAKTNGTFETAQSVSLGTTVYGFHPKYSTIDHDLFAVQLQKGERLALEVWSSCLGFQHFRGMSDIALTVYGPERKKIAYADDSSLRDMDPILSLIAPQAGTYYVDVHQNMDFEGTLRHYAVHFSDAPRPRITYPLGGQAGTTLQGRALGDVRGALDFRLALPAQPGRFEKSMVAYFAPGTAIPNRIQVAKFPSILEDGEEHFRPEDAQHYTGRLPVAFNGRIEHEGKTDWFRFTAKKGERYRIRTYAATLGSPLDATLEVRPAPSTKSRINITSDDSLWVDHDWWGKDKIWFIKDRMDPVVAFTADVDGEYLLGVRDAQRLFGPEHAYRVEFQPLKDHAFLYFPTDYREAPQKRDRLVIPRGNTIEHTLAVLPGTGNTYRGGMRVVARGLPPGVKFQCPPLQPGQKLTQANLTAAPDAPAWSGLIELNLEPLDSSAEFSGSFVHNVPSTQRRGGNEVIFNRTRRCALAVVEEAPFHVRVKQPRVGLAQNAQVDLEVEVQRAAGFDEAIRVYAAWTPAGVTIPVPLIIPAGESHGVYRLQASGNAEPGSHPITLTAQEDKGGDRAWGTGFHFVASPPIQLRVVRPYLDIQLARTAIERQTSGEIQATIKTITPLPDKAVATLVRLPKGVQLLEPATIQPGDKAVRFSVRVTKDCLVGQYQEIGCEIAFEANGQKIIQQTGNGVLRIDAERK